VVRASKCLKIARFGFGLARAKSSWTYGPKLASTRRDESALRAIDPRRARRHEPFRNEIREGLVRLQPEFEPRQSRPTGKRFDLSKVTIFTIFFLDFYNYKLTFSENVNSDNFYVLILNFGVRFYEKNW